MVHFLPVNFCQNVNQFINPVCVRSRDIDINPYAFKMLNDYNATQPVGVFRSSFARLTLWVHAIAIPLGVAAVVFTYGTEPYVLALAISLIVATLCGVGLMAIVVTYLKVFKVYVYGDRLRRYGFGGRYRDVKWEDVESITSRNFVGLKYVRIHDKCPGRNISLPPYLNEMRQFTNLVGQHAAPTNLLTRYLREREQ